MPPAPIISMSRKCPRVSPIIDSPPSVRRGYILIRFPLSGQSGPHLETGADTVLNDMTREATPEPDPPLRLRLVWSNPNPAPPRRSCLATAIERHLAGRDGLSDDAF